MIWEGREDSDRDEIGKDHEVRRDSGMSKTTMPKGGKIFHEEVWPMMLNAAEIKENRE